MNRDGTGFHTCKECHKTEYLWNHTTADHKEGEQLEDRRSVGTSSCYSGDGTNRNVHLVFDDDDDDYILDVTMCRYILIIPSEYLFLQLIKNYKNVTTNAFYT